MQTERDPVVSFRHEPFKEYTTSLTFQEEACAKGIVKDDPYQILAPAVDPNLGLALIVGGDQFYRFAFFGNKLILVNVSCSLDGNSSQQEKERGRVSL